MLDYNLDITKDSVWIIATQNTIRQSMPFYLIEVGNFFANSTYFTTRSEDDNYYVIYTVSGSGILEIDGNKIELLPNHALILNSKKWHSYKTNSKELWVDYWMHIKGVGILGYFDFLESKPIKLSFDVDIVANFNKIIANSKENDLCSASIISNEISNVLTKMFISHFDNHKKINKTRHAIIIKAINFIETNYSKKITIDDIIKIVNMSKFHFVRIFSEYVGMTPYNYLIHFRIDTSKRLLCTSDDSVSEISRKVGYSSESNFTSQFKNITGLTPTVFRKNNINWEQIK